jgi:hypothetical protein
MSYPYMMRIRQYFESPTLHDVTSAVREDVAKLLLSTRVKPGESIAVTVGSRGIANIALIIKTLIEELKSLGAKPFVVPAMGSHGGGVAEAQRAIVESYGITEDYIGVPIKSTMEVAYVGTTEDGIPIFFDKFAYEADHVAVVGRIKPHTIFTGQIESGLHKMMLIGLGKHRGAIVYHQAIPLHNFDHIIRSVGKAVIEKCHILLGLAIIENQYDKTALIRALPPEEFYEGEKELLLLAKKWMPRLPFQQADLLIVDQIGKNISGSGMDTNVIGRKYHDHHAHEGEFPKITCIYVLDLTEETHGNAAGIGRAEYTRTQLVKKIDFESTYVNCITANRPSAASIPIHYDSDQRVLDVALTTTGLVKPENARIIRIHDTLNLREVLVSKAYEEEMKNRMDLEIIEPAKPMEFDMDGNLLRSHLKTPSCGRG